MTPQSELEIKSTFLKHPFAELLVEIAQAGLHGSLRVAKNETKCVVYFKAGQVVFAVSNARSTRLFDVLLRKGKLKKDDLVQIPNFSNDFEFTKFLVEKNTLAKAECDLLFIDQIRGIVLDMMTWSDGEWCFSPLARIREGLSFEIDMAAHLMKYSRSLSKDVIRNRFRTLDETFRRTTASEMNWDLTPEEGFVLSRAQEGQLSASDLISVSAMPEAGVLHTLYTLWLGGLLIRDNWNPAFSREFVSAMNSAKFDLKAETKPTPATKPEPVIAEPEVPQPAEAIEELSPNQPDGVIALEDYLIRVENAATHYDVLGVDAKAEASELKRAYFHLAKNFHPDRYHSEGGSQLKRIQSAFTELAQAHETLKNAESREIYDYRMRKELAEREKREASGQTGTDDRQTEQAAENFDRGLSLLIDNDDAEAAVPYFARAAHFAPKNARYRAYYGRALASDEKHRHKAEGELQAALKIDPNNPTYRIMLAEFFIQFNLMKRAEGELNRLLAVFPSNREARELLDSIKVNS
ncbi:MAG: DnaJ domain-containing protein [Pyrinomonadaceae bacterium]